MDSFLILQVRNLCYMVSRREKLKVLQSKAQEQMFNLHVKLLNQELSAGEPSVVLQLASHLLFFANILLGYLDHGVWSLEHVLSFFVVRSSYFIASGEYAVSASSKDNSEAENAQILKSWKWKFQLQIW